MLPKRNASDMDDSDEELPSYGRQILPVANLPENFDGEPEDGLQYLFTVRREFHRLPHVTRVANPYELPPPSAPLPQNAEASSRPSRLPSMEWRTTFERRFRNFRKNIAQPEEFNGEPSGKKILPDMRDRDKWWQFLRGAPESVWNPPKRPKVDKERRRQHGRDRPHEDTLGPWTPVNPSAPSNPPEHGLGSTYEGDWQTDPSNDNSLGRQAFATPEHYSVSTTIASEASAPVNSDMSVDASSYYKPPKPTPALLREVDSRYALHLLMYFAYWINLHLEHLEGHESVPVPPPSPHPISASHLLWIFTLLARVEDAPSADDTAQLRSLARGCVGLIKVTSRSGMATDEAKVMFDKAKVPEENPRGFVVACWMVLAAVTSVWAQHDLWEDAEESLAA